MCAPSLVALREASILELLKFVLAAYH
jgi:hypothetical protein